MNIRLGIERFWNNPSDIERWPEILKKLPDIIPALSKSNIAKTYLGFKVDTKGRVLNTDEFYGLFGLEKKGTHMTIAGCNLIELTNDGYKKSEDAQSLIQAYETNNKWEIILAEQVLKYSPRVRIIIYSLINGGKLKCPKGFLKQQSQSYLTYMDHEYYIFSNKKDKLSINHLMDTNPEVTLGKFWLNKINPQNNSLKKINFSGVTKEKPSIKDIGLYLKIPFSLFQYLGWIKEEAQELFTINIEKIKSDLSGETLGSLYANQSQDKDDILKGLIEEYSDFRGLFPVNLVGKKLKNLTDKESSMSTSRWIDAFFYGGFNDKRFKLVSHEQGQPRHGRGLLDKNECQLIKIEFL